MLFFFCLGVKKMHITHTILEKNTATQKKGTHTPTKKFARFHYRKKVEKMGPSAPFSDIFSIMKPHKF